MSALPKSGSLAQIAVGEYRRRLETAHRKLAARALTTAQAEAHLRPWAALALRCGADPAELHDELRLAFDAIRYEHEAVAHVAHVLVADDLCALGEIRRVIAAARDAAISRGIADPSAARAQRGHDLVTLAIAIGAPPSSPTDAERMAA